MAINYEIGLRGKIFESSTKTSACEELNSASMMTKRWDEQKLPDPSFCRGYYEIKSNPPSNQRNLVIAGPKSHPEHRDYIKTISP
jgi:hypothetical protein